jgi:hypothetical protein
MKDWIYKDTHLGIMYLVLRDQSHIVTWLLPLVLYTSQFTFKTTQPTSRGAHFVATLSD